MVFVWTRWEPNVPQPSGFSPHGAALSPCGAARDTEPNGSFSWAPPFPTFRRLGVRQLNERIATHSQQDYASDSSLSTLMKDF